MDNLWLVYLDNSDDQKTVPGLFRHYGLQNFFLVQARDNVEAKRVALSVFARQSNQTLVVLDRCMSVTKLSVLVDYLVNGNVNVWSYTPLGQTQQPGQRVPKPNIDQMIRQQQGSGETSHQNFTVPKPRTVGVDHTNVQLAPGEASGVDQAIANGASTTPQVFNTAGFTPEQMQQMMTMMATMMGQQPPQQVMTPADVPESVPGHAQDPETAARLQENMNKLKSEELTEEIIEPSAEELAQLEELRAKMGNG